jgi:hypothetical protein
MMMTWREVCARPYSAVAVADQMLGKSSVPWDPRPCDPHLTWYGGAGRPYQTNAEIARN